VSRVAWSAFHPLVLSEVPMCPKPMVTKAIRDAAIEFCERTAIWKDTQEYPVGLDAEYEFEGDSESIVHRIDSAKIVNGPDLEIESPERVDELYPSWRDGTLAGQPAVLTQLAPRTFHLVPAPSSDMILTLGVALKPAKGSQYTDSWLHEEYEEAIAAGALARLLSMPRKSWTSTSDAATFAAVFNDRIAGGNLRAAKAFGRAPLRVRAQFM